jgi:hypothetical protein
MLAFLLPDDLLNRLLSGQNSGQDHTLHGSGTQASLFMVWEMLKRAGGGHKTLISPTKNWRTRQDSNL